MNSANTAWRLDLRQAALAVVDRLGALGVQATGVASDSREVQPGDVFLAFPGGLADGRNYIDAAIQRGAVAVLWEPEGVVAQMNADVPHFPVPDLRGMAGWLAHALAGWPSEQVPVLAVTGTNGKTTISQWLAACYPRQCASIGTLGAGFAGAIVETGFTTPEATNLVRWLKRLQQGGAQAFALEASSIGIEEGRMNGLHVDAALFTNFTRDHLDYHGSMEAYAAAKKRLFVWPRLRLAVINIDDPLGLQLMRETTAAKVVAYSIAQERPQYQAVIWADAIEDTAQGQRFVLHTPVGRGVVESNLVGRYNLSNMLAVAGVLFDAGLPVREIADRLSSLQAPPGRMQVYGGKVAGESAPLVLVDYAHTPDALENALRALRPVALARGGALQVVFGCGGDRDPGKRPMMGAVSAALADQVWVTSDNPRSENPETIINAILPGVGETPVTVIADRAEAIRAAIAAAQAVDVILLAGKGHETYQEIAGVRYPFDDSVQATQALIEFWTRQDSLAESPEHSENSA